MIGKKSRQQKSEPIGTAEISVSDSEAQKYFKEAAAVETFVDAWMLQNFDRKSAKAQAEYTVMHLLPPGMGVSQKLIQSARYLKLFYREIDARYDMAEAAAS